MHPSNVDGESAHKYMEGTWMDLAMASSSCEFLWSAAFTWPITAPSHSGMIICQHRSEWVLQTIWADRLSNISHAISIDWTQDAVAAVSAAVPSLKLVHVIDVVAA